MLFELAPATLQLDLAILDDAGEVVVLGEGKRNAMLTKVFGRLFAALRRKAAVVGLKEARRRSTSTRLADLDRRAALHLADRARTSERVSHVDHPTRARADGRPACGRRTRPSERSGLAARTARLGSGSNLLARPQHRIGEVTTSRLR